jgi:hypothetical protein
MSMTKGRSSSGEKLPRGENIAIGRHKASIGAHASDTQAVPLDAQDAFAEPELHAIGCGNLGESLRELEAVAGFVAG